MIDKNKNIKPITSQYKSVAATNIKKFFIQFLLILLVIGNVQILSAKPQPKKKTTQKTVKATKQTTKKATAKSSKKTATKKAAAKKNEEIVVEENQPSTSGIALSQDTTKPSVVTITSSFKPSLRTAAKINLDASTPALDTTHLKLSYSIPAQNLFFTYQPVPIKPLSLSADSSFEWKNQQYIKVGYGNFATPLVQAAAAFGHPNQILFTANGNYVSSKGNLPFQEFTKAGVKLDASVGSIANHDLIASVGYNLSSQYKYGTTAKYNFNKDSLQQTFNSIDVAAALANKSPTGLGILYQPQLRFNAFFDNNKASETSFFITAPLTKVINNNIQFKVAATADITSYKNDYVSFSNNIFYVEPALIFNNNILKVNVGVNPSWNNSDFKFLPNLFAEYKLASEKLALTAGWLGYYEKNTYKNLATYNPYIEQPWNNLNTKTTEEYFGLKGVLGNHFSFNGQLSFLQYTNKAFFANKTDSLKTQTFEILYEPKSSAVQIAGELAYTNKEKFSCLAAIKYLQFTQQDSLAKPFGIVPLQITTSVKYKILKDFFVKADAMFNSGSYYRIQTIQTDKTNAAFDLNIGAEYKILNKLNLFLDINNLFNNQYQRWHQYQVLGLNVVAGVVYSFK